MKRRQFLAGLAVLSVARVHAQAPARSGRLPRVGIYLTSPLKSLERDYVKPFIEGMRELKWVDRSFDGRGNVSTVVYDLADAPHDLQNIPADKATMRELAEKLVARKPDVIWLSSSLSADALLEVLRTDANLTPIPVVGAAVSEVISRKYVKSIPWPGGNFTGINNYAWELGVKRFQYLYETMPRVARVGVLVVPGNANCLQELKTITEVAARVRVAVISAEMSQEDQANAAFAELAKKRAEAVLIAHHPLFQNHRKTILQLAEKHRIPAIGHRTYFAEEGALLSYGSVLDLQMRRSAHLVDKILRGAKPGDIPVEQPTSLEFVVNLKTAKKLGLTVPQEVLLRADRTIE